MKKKTKIQKDLDELVDAVKKLPDDRKDALFDELESNELDLGELDLKAIIKSDPDLRSFTLEEISRAYEISTRSLQKYIAEGKLKAVRFGKRYLVTLKALKEFFDSQG